MQDLLHDKKHVKSDSECGVPGKIPESRAFLISRNDQKRSNHINILVDRFPTSCGWDNNSISTASSAPMHVWWWPGIEWGPKESLSWIISLTQEAAELECSTVGLCKPLTLWHDGTSKIIGGIKDVFTTIWWVGPRFDFFFIFEKPIDVSPTMTISCSAHTGPA